jgi:hypothetical protein
MVSQRENHCPFWPAGQLPSRLRKYSPNREKELFSLHRIGKILWFFRAYASEKCPLRASENGPNPPLPPFSKGGMGGFSTDNDEFHSYQHVSFSLALSA